MFSLHHGDSLDVLKTFEDNSVDSIVTDPPYPVKVKVMTSAIYISAIPDTMARRAYAGYN